MLVFSKSTQKTPEAFWRSRPRSTKNFRKAFQVIFGGNSIYHTFALVNEATEGNGFVPFFIFYGK
jgi:hypothetical protein